MNIDEIYRQFIYDMQHTSWLEYVGVFSGIVSVYFSRLENIWVYPTGLINTIIYIGLSIKYHLPGEASVNLYYTIMSIYGWYLWMKKDTQNEYVLRVEHSDKKMWLNQVLFFLFFYIALFVSLTYLKEKIFKEAIPWADAFASATAFTGMWLMAKKKVESWYWWLATNIASIPLYFVKGLVFTSVYYIVLFIMAIFGLIEWQKRAKKQHG